MWGASPGWHPTVVAQSVARERSELSDGREAQAVLGAREELREHLLRFADPHAAGGDPVLEADILGLCMYLQRQRGERGEPCIPLRHLAVFVTDRGERCSFEHQRGRVDAVLERPAREPCASPTPGSSSRRWRAARRWRWSTPPGRSPPSSATWSRIQARQSS